jgi:predicted protein tyrosine phosphatase
MKKGSDRLKVLFICNLNMMRSPTAEEIFKNHPNLEVRSAGVSRSAVVPLHRDLLLWADMVFVMEKRQQDFIEAEFKGIKDLQIISLNISDCYDYMDPDLIHILKKSVESYLPDD